MPLSANTANWLALAEGDRSLSAYTDNPGFAPLASKQCALTSENGAVRCTQKGCVHPVTDNTLVSCNFSEILFKPKSVENKGLSMNNGHDPTARRRLDKERQNDRDTECWRLMKQGLGPRAIARSLGMAPSSVQRCLERVQKMLADEQAETDALTAELDAVVASYSAGLTVEDVSGPDHIAVLSDLEYHRLRYLPEEHPVRQVWAAAVAAGCRRPPTPPAVYPVGEQCGHWRDGLSGDHHDDTGDEW
jgi:DNA-binding CsgD family transcriptional regulator